MEQRKSSLIVDNTALYTASYCQNTELLNTDKLSILTTHQVHWLLLLNNHKDKVLMTVRIHHYPPC